MWILIIITFASPAAAGPSSVAMQEFSSQYACDFAGKEAKSLSKQLDYVCVQK